MHQIHITNLLNLFMRKLTIYFEIYRHSKKVQSDFHFTDEATNSSEERNFFFFIRSLFQWQMYKFNSLLLALLILLTCIPSIQYNIVLHTTLCCIHSIILNYFFSFVRSFVFLFSILNIYFSTFNTQSLYWLTDCLSGYIYFNKW